MSLWRSRRNGLGMEIDLNLVRKIVGNDRYSRKAIELVLKNGNKGRIQLATPNQNDFEIFLTLFHFKLALPLNSINDSLSWNSRILSQSTKELEIPYIIRIVFSELGKKGKANVKDAIVDYFRKIGEDRPEDFFNITVEVFEAAENLIVCGNEISRISQRYGRDGGIVISELKGAGIISPFSGCGAAFQSYGKKYGSPVYEVHRFLYEVFKALKLEGLKVLKADSKMLD